MKTSVFIKVICTSYAAVKLKPERNWGWNRTQTLGYQSSVLQLSYQVNWELVKKQFCNIPIDGEEMEVNIWKIRYYELTNGVWITYVSTCLFLSSTSILWTHQFPVPSWLDSSVGMHCTSITKVMGSNPVQAWIFQVLISELLKFCV